MFYQECGQCAKNNLDLESLIIKIDQKLESLPLSSIIRSEIFAQLLSEKESQVSGVLDLLVGEKLLIKKKYFECPNPLCENLIDIDEYKKNKTDGDPLECSQCQADITKKVLKEISVYRFNPHKFIKKPNKISVEEKIPAFSANNKMTILFVSSDPINADRLRLSEESREIREKLKLAINDDYLIFEQREAVRPSDLSQALLDIKPQIVHFSGHGTTTGAICLEDKMGNVHTVEPEALASLFELMTDHVRCVVLNACYAEAQAREISKFIPYVIGMNNSISDAAAIAFSVGFYQGIGAGRSIDDAFKLGLSHIRLHGLPEHQVPVLIKK